MELITYEFSLDTHKNGSQRTLQGFETGDTYSRRFVISLVEGDESYKLPLDNAVAVMYVKRPSQSSPSINACTIEGNQIIYDVESTDLIEEGITQMQLKVVEGTIASPFRVLVSPRFDVEVWESLVSDSEAEDTQTYTALEEAIIKAQMAYDARITSFAFDENLVLTVTYGVANDYNDSKAYAVNDICYYAGKAWKCLTACTGETPEEGTYWTEVDLSYAKVTYTTDLFKDTVADIIADVEAHYPTIAIGTVTEGESMSVTNSGTAQHAVFDFTLVKGDKGETGYSPEASVEKVDDTATITITDQEGTTTATISDGYSPSASVSKVDDTATITLTDKSGTTTASITDGTDGVDGYSPIANVEKVGTTATITITDKVGTTTATISDGTGTTVTWTGTQLSGTEVGKLNINGTDNSLYAPTPPSNLADLSDVTEVSATNGQVLTKIAGGWGNADIPSRALDDLSDVDVTSASSGEVLGKTSVGWGNVPVTIPENPADTTDLNIWIEYEEEP